MLESVLDTIGSDISQNSQLQPLYATILHEYAELLIAQDKSPSAFETLKQVLEIRQQYCGQHISIACTYVSLARCSLKMKKFNDAQMHAASAQAMFETLSPEHMQAKQLIYIKAEVLTALGDFDGAMELVLGGINYFTEVLGAKHVYITDGVILKGMICAARGTYKHAGSNFVKGIDALSVFSSQAMTLRKARYVVNYVLYLISICK